MQQQYGSAGVTTVGGYPHPHPQSYRTKPRKPKTQLRDVFQKDDEWVDEDEHRYVGGLGQSSCARSASGAGTGTNGASTYGGGASMASSAWIDGQRTSLNALPSYGSSAVAMQPGTGLGGSSKRYNRPTGLGMSGGLALGGAVTTANVTVIEEEEDDGHVQPEQQPQKGKAAPQSSAPPPRRGVPPGRAQPAIIQEEEEEEEE